MSWTPGGALLCCPWPRHPYRTQNLAPSPSASITPQGAVQGREETGASTTGLCGVGRVANGPGDGCPRSGPTEQSLVGGRSCMCGGCHVAHYCTRGCQIAHWRRHKPVCKALAARTGSSNTRGPLRRSEVGPSDAALDCSSCRSWHGTKQWLCVAH